LGVPRASCNPVLVYLITMSYGSSYNVSSAYSATVEQRVGFIRKTYLHLAGAIGLFVALSTVFYTSGVGEGILRTLAQSSYMWLLILGGFTVLGYMAQALARSDRPLGTQYFGLGLYTAAEALIFSPMIFIAARFYPGILPQAAVITLTTFIGLSGFVLIYNKDFSFLRTALVAAGWTALAMILASVLFGFNLGIWFSGAMILFASGAILYSTSNVMKYYRVDQYVAASLELFAAVALLFWYVLRILMELNRR
jgi:FtsH-binding integral membrane protein